MGIFSQTVDTYASFRFLRLLTTNWEDTGAFKAGLIDKDGKQIRKAETSDERSVYNIFHRLVFNVKRLINKVPFGKTTIASYLTALYLIKEHTGLTEDEIKDILIESTGISDFPILSESTHTLLAEGKYELKTDVVHPKTGSYLSIKGSFVEVRENTTPIGFMFGQSLFEVWHEATRSNIIITPSDIYENGNDL